MKLTQQNERTFTVVLSDAELEDLVSEAVIREYSALEIMKAVFFSVFVQIVSCRWRRAILSPLDEEKRIDKARARDNEYKGEQ